MPVLKPLIYLGIFVGILIGLVWVSLSVIVNNSEELSSKRPNSLLQALAVSHAETHIENEHSPRVIIKSFEECTAAGVLDGNTHNRVWILLNPKHEPFIKVYPKVDFYLTATELNYIQSETQVSPEVLQYLTSRVNTN